MNREPDNNQFDQPVNGTMVPARARLAFRLLLVVAALGLSQSLWNFLNFNGQPTVVFAVESSLRWAAVVLVFGLLLWTGWCAREELQARVILKDVASNLKRRKQKQKAVLVFAVLAGFLSYSIVFSGLPFVAHMLTAQRGSTIVTVSAIPTVSRGNHCTPYVDVAELAAPEAFVCLTEAQFRRVAVGDRLALAGRLSRFGISIESVHLDREAAEAGLRPRSQS